MHHHLRRAAALAAFAATLTLSSCAQDADDPDSDESPAPAADADLAALVPDDLRGATLSAVIGDSNPPLYSRTESGDLTGITYDLGIAAAELLGVELDVEANSFESSIPGLQSGTYDVSLWGTDITEERMRVIDQVPVGRIGYTFLTAESAEPLADTMDAICGLTVAAIAGQTTIGLLEEQSAACEAAGDGSVTVSTFDDQASAGLAVKSGRADAATVNSVSGIYIAAQDEELALTGPTFNEHLTGIATAQDSGLGEAFAAALQQLVDDGSYEEIIRSYDADTFLIDEIAVNPPTDG
ncbi:transporter substrate-binding domain-containing protein [Streptomyces radicis]|uniref:Solute-binding protein family 3/N-terminal domain-containing protein n=1 Tax=Streptomyces radicis TaxID=1750517 RepID=A0A3A9WIL2_9ACTN|nr:transporter substrate-binding domain-containing protein [Streptomyces radicis]RKN12432.1 hypothetical protein D7319_00185 [Streptomyces radicis]RKN27798.1 hypothetical protein D7318_02705 [Streptomyces radicis]